MTENELKVFIFLAFKQNVNLAVCSFSSRSISMSDIYIGFFIADNFSFFIESRHKIGLDLCGKKATSDASHYLVP